MNDSQNFTLNERVLIAALSLSEGSVTTKFTAEEVIVKAWEDDNSAFGLRGYESKFPDSNIVFTKLDGKDGLVAKGLLKKVGERAYTISEAGLTTALRLKPHSEELQLKATRALQEAIIKIIDHPIFKEWLKNKEKPTQFRDAGWFWSIAAGSPPKIVNERLKHIEQTLSEAKRFLEESNMERVIQQRGKILFDLKDLELCSEFHNTLKKRFDKELKILLRGR
ncbi:hypothetical protein HYU40_05050 [Candidatus Woesearchaeota archaeon]|nr:hypothetical protein [Candidatus Woesearchaeota archaeon]